MSAHINVVIVNYNVRHFLARCIDSINKSKLNGIEVSIYVVDNASVDGSVQMLQTDYPEVHLIANEHNVGFSKANNQAIRIINGEFILVLNPDTVIQEDTLQTCYDYMKQNVHVGALGVKMIDGTGKFLPESKRALPTAWNSLSKLVGLSSIFEKSRLFNGYALGHLSSEEKHKIEVLCGAFMFVRTSAIEKVGMFDERFFMYGEDIDWSKRIGEGGYEIHYIPDTTIIHYKGESTKKGSLNYVKTFYNAMNLYVDKHYTSSSGRWFSRILQLGIHFRGGLSAFRRIVSGALRPIIDVFFIVIGLKAFALLWAKMYFKNSSYYEGTSIDLAITGYAIVWTFVLWFIGYYKKRTWQKRLMGIGSGLLIILSVYSLLTESYRTSRIIVLFGAVWTALVTWITGFKNRSESKGERKNVLIVAEKNTAKGIQEILERAKVNVNILGFVNPSFSAPNDLDYLNTIHELGPLSRVLKINEVIFSTESMSMQDIMKQMMSLDSKIEFKIAGDDSLSILGSSSKNKTGELYTLNLNYNLNQDYYKHTKRSLDIGLGILMLALFPILIFANRMKVVSYLKHCIQVIVGRKSWVSYGGEKQDFENLPVLKDGILECQRIEDDDIKKVNMYYARDYSVWQDIELLFYKINKIGG